MVANFIFIVYRAAARPSSWLPETDAEMGMTGDKKPGIALWRIAGARVAGMERNSVRLQGEPSSRPLPG